MAKIEVNGILKTTISLPSMLNQLNQQTFSTLIVDAINKAVAPQFTPISKVTENGIGISKNLFQQLSQSQVRFLQFD